MRKINPLVLGFAYGMKDGEIRKGSGCSAASNPKGCATDAITYDIRQGNKLIVICSNCEEIILENKDWFSHNEFPNDLTQEEIDNIPEGFWDLIRSTII